LAPWDIEVFFLADVYSREEQLLTDPFHMNPNIAMKNYNFSQHFVISMI
jgi:hypothetical protein